MAYGTMEPQMPEQCRVCMSILAPGTKTNWRNIFTHADSNQMLCIIEEVTGQKVKQRANLPERICLACLAAAKTALKFKRRLEKSFELLKQNKTRSEEVLSEKTISSVNDLESLTEDDSEDSYSGQPENDSKRPFQCSQCSKTFTHNNSLTRHLRIHTGVRPFECSQCSKTFTQKSNLQNHLRTHTGERPFECSKCSKSFAQSINLETHLRLHTGERPFECSHCLKTFTKKCSLNDHLRTHTGERPFKCSQCSKTFVHGSSLKSHLRSHTNERPFVCSLCSRTFTQRGGLKYHLRTHNDDAKYLKTLKKRRN